MKQKEKKQKTKYDTIMNKRELRLQRGQKPMIGIDIGTDFIKIVQMKKNSRISKLGMKSIPEGMVNQGRIEASTSLAEEIKRALSQNKIKGNRCSLCLSGSELIVRELKIPEMSESQIFENIKYEITSFLPLNHDDYCIDYKVLEYIPSQDTTPAKLRLMVAAVPNSLVQNYINTLKKARLKVSYVDVAPNIAGKIARWIMSNSADKNINKNICMIDFGAHTTDITILKDGNYFIHKSIINGGDYITSLIADKMNLDLMEAEAFKLKTNLFDENFHNSVNQHIKNFIDFQITDIERTIEFFNNRNNNVGVDQIYIMGGGSLLSGLAKYMEEHLSVSVSLLSDALKQFKNGNIFGDKVSVFSQAIGATMREEC